MLKISYTKQFIFLLPLVFLFFSFFFQLNNTKNNQIIPPINSDEHQYLNMSLNIYKHKTISHDDPRTTPTPSNYREPIYPIFLSFFYNFLDWGKYDFTQCVYEFDERNCTKFYNLIKSANFLIFFTIIIQILFYLKSSPYLASLVSFVIFFIVPSNTITNTSPELLSASIFISFSFLFSNNIFNKKNSLKNILFTSFIFALLILIKNIFYYYLYILILISLIILIYRFIYTGFIKNLNYYFDFHFNIKLILLCFLTLILVLPYQLRNLYYFDNSSLSKRGPEVLTLRNQFIDFSYPEIFEGFKYYSPNIFGLKDNYLNLKNSNNNFKFYEQNKNSYWRGYNRSYGIVVSHINNKYDTNYSSVEFIKPEILMSESVNIYINNLYKQSLVSVLMLYKGINNHYSYTDRKFIINLLNDLIWFFSIFLFFYLFYKALIKKNIYIIFLGLPTVVYIFFMSTLTHYEPRFNFTIIYFCIIYILKIYVEKKHKN